ncbi:SDR family NAD(P)-dependent oxidoreductase [Paracoccus benzoatiresistens]|uniref:SDR family NAD(P)-dependent oxidoreductase n=1 Tax=Paracoccus benzoatiresistens TaxID=2997341 RepID=A0ABT4J1L4_9RHOB|nr:SDR family NAD(P)-dependent oxidoreductase [Paracoccus sp. EF6]MCZ0961004.1 SDR family NAD(P)-dependent oxidoreductase [Paracoccus sp. EF6]
MDQDGVAVVIGASGGIGAALLEGLQARGRFRFVLGLSRPELDLTDHGSIAQAARRVGAIGAPGLIIVASGLLHGPGIEPEKTIRSLDPAAMATAFAVNAIGPALVLRDFLPLMPRDRRAVFAALSAKVGSIGDNRLGGWYSYRASKAALNQIIRTAAIEMRRTHPQAICAAFHPGTVATGLSGKFSKTGLQVQQPAEAAAALLDSIDRLTPEQSGSFLDRFGAPIPW